MSAASPKSFLVIQTAFIGDVILATALVEKLHLQFPDARIDFLLRKGNEKLLDGHPFLNRVLIWDKHQGKIANLMALTRQVRAARYDAVINAHRFASSGWITARSGARERIGFSKNPFSFWFTHRIQHQIGEGIHEVDRNQKLIEHLTGSRPAMPRLYPTAADRSHVAMWQKDAEGRKLAYVCVAPTSVWFTKQWARERWVELIKRLPDYRVVYLLGAPADRDACEWILRKSGSPQVVNLAGELTFLQSAALMKDAAMNYVNDSAPMHLASAVDAPVTAIYCSTLPSFGFGPLSSNSRVVETHEKLDCRPCGLHGHRQCPRGHFKCSSGIQVEQLLETLN